MEAIEDGAIQSRGWNSEARYHVVLNQSKSSWLPAASYRSRLTQEGPSPANWLMRWPSKYREMGLGPSGRVEEAEVMSMGPNIPWRRPRTENVPASVTSTKASTWSQSKYPSGGLEVSTPALWWGGEESPGG